MPLPVTVAMVTAGKGGAHGGCGEASADSSVVSHRRGSALPSEGSVPAIIPLMHFRRALFLLSDRLVLISAQELLIAAG